MKRCPYSVVIASFAQRLHLLLLLLVVLLAQDAPHRIFEFNRNGGLWTINGEGWASATIAGDTFLSEKADQTALFYSYLRQTLLPYG
jgi:hypothetical protein